MQFGAGILYVFEKGERDTLICVKAWDSMSSLTTTMSSTTAGALAIACVVGAATLLYAPGSSRPPYPPGPRRKPLIGNVLDMPTQAPEATFMQWRERYGEMRRSVASRGLQ